MASQANSSTEGTKDHKPTLFAWKQIRWGELQQKFEKELDENRQHFEHQIQQQRLRHKQEIADLHIKLQSQAKEVELPDQRIRPNTDNIYEQQIQEVVASFTRTLELKEDNFKEQLSIKDDIIRQYKDEVARLTAIKADNSARHDEKMNQWSERLHQMLEEKFALQSDIQQMKSKVSLMIEEKARNDEQLRIDKVALEETNQTITKLMEKLRQYETRGAIIATTISQNVAKRTIPPTDLSLTNVTRRRRISSLSQLGSSSDMLADEFQFDLRRNDEDGLSIVQASVAPASGSTRQGLEDDENVSSIPPSTVSPPVERRSIYNIYERGDGDMVLHHQINQMSIQQLKKKLDLGILDDMPLLILQEIVEIWTAVKCDKTKASSIHLSTKEQLHCVATVWKGSSSSWDTDNKALGNLERTKCCGNCSKKGYVCFLIQDGMLKVRTLSGSPGSKVEDYVMNYTSIV